MCSSQALHPCLAWSSAYSPIDPVQSRQRDCWCVDWLAACMILVPQCLSRAPPGSRHVIVMRQVANLAATYQCTKRMCCPGKNITSAMCCCAGPGCQPAASGCQPDHHGECHGVQHAWPGLSRHPRDLQELQSGGSLLCCCGSPACSSHSSTTAICIRGQNISLRQTTPSQVLTSDWLTSSTCSWFRIRKARQEWL